MKARQSWWNSWIKWLAVATAGLVCILTFLSPVALVAAFGCLLNREWGAACFFVGTTLTSIDEHFIAARIEFGGFIENHLR